MYAIASPTTERFHFDVYCEIQLFLFSEPAASGAVLWDGSRSNAAVDDMPFHVISWESLRPERTAPMVSGALLVDAGFIFSVCRDCNTSTPLHGWSTFDLWKDTALYDARPGVIEQQVSLLPSVSRPEPLALAPVPAAIAELATPYAELLNDLRATSPWRSWKKLASSLGTSHTQLRRIADGTVAVPGPDLAQRIDELHRFARRLARLSNGNPTVETRLLTTRRARDGKTATDFLRTCAYRDAFHAVMDAASPRPRVPAIAAVPLRWYDEPSRDLHDDRIDFEE